MLLRDLGYRVGVMKPVETGCAERDGMLVPEDADATQRGIRLRRGHRKNLPLSICPSHWRRASRRKGQGVRIDVDHLLRRL